MRPSSALRWQSFRKDAGLLLAAGVAVHLVMFSSLSLKFLNPLADDSTHRRGQAVDFYLAENKVEWLDWEDALPQA